MPDVWVIPCGSDQGRFVVLLGLRNESVFPEARSETVMVTLCVLLIVLAVGSLAAIVDVVESL
jgi:hypothetical protein